MTFRTELKLDGAVLHCYSFLRMRWQSGSLLNKTGCRQEPELSGCLRCMPEQNFPQHSGAITEQWTKQQ